MCFGVCKSVIIMGGRQNGEEEIVRREYGSCVIEGWYYDYIMMSVNVCVVISFLRVYQFLGFFGRGGEYIGEGYF